MGAPGGFDEELMQRLVEPALARIHSPESRVEVIRHLLLAAAAIAVVGDGREWTREAIRIGTDLQLDLVLRMAQHCGREEEA